MEKDLLAKNGDFLFLTYMLTFVNLMKCISQKGAQFMQIYLETRSKSCNSDFTTQEIV